MPKTKEEWKVYENVFSSSSLRKLFSLSSKGLFEELLSPIKTGKEANIFSAITKDGSKIIIKIYRVENCNFNQIWSYLRNDPRYFQIKKKQRQMVFLWTEREYRNLKLAEKKAKVPHPIAFLDNILLMEYLGNDEGPFPQLKDISIKNKNKMFNTVLNEIESLIDIGLIHGDLSEYNILVENPGTTNETPILIDFSQATPIKSPNALELLERDLGNICRFFGKTDTFKGKLYTKLSLKIKELVH